jgi:hypothetical protein
MKKNKLVEELDKIVKVIEEFKKYLKETEKTIKKDFSVNKLCDMITEHRDKYDFPPSVLLISDEDFDDFECENAVYLHHGAIIRDLPLFMGLRIFKVNEKNIYEVH